MKIEQGLCGLTVVLLAGGSIHCNRPCETIYVDEVVGPDTKKWIKTKGIYPNCFWAVESSTSEGSGGSTEGSGSGSSGGTTSGGPICGDGVQEGAEVCDDGNDVDEDGCLSNCVAASCGDGNVCKDESCAVKEECDDGNTEDEDACVGCKEARCGDGVVQAGVEECDDGNMIATDACLSTCVSASCGDGEVWMGMEACDDGNAQDTDACTSMCEAATCGDGFVWEGQEACDDGTENGQYGFCAEDCSGPGERCGDGVKNGPEQCDDGKTGGATDGCTDECREARVVFVATLVKFAGELGGLTEADGECTKLADLAGVPNAGTRSFKVWLSNGTQGPAQRFTGKNFQGLYVGLDGSVVVDGGWADLTDGTLDAVIHLRVNEGGIVSETATETIVISHTKADGTSQPGNMCNGWTSTMGGGVVGYGKANATLGKEWTEIGPENIPTLCGTSVAIYCFED